MEGSCHGILYDGVSKSFRTGSLERELQMVQLSATVSQSSEFCRHSPSFCFSTRVYCCCYWFYFVM